MTQSTTNSVRIDKDLLDKIRVISASKGQTIVRSPKCGMGNAP